MGAAVARIGRVVLGQLVPLIPDLINWFGVAVVPTVPFPYNIIVGAALNGIGKAIRDRKESWTWVPV